MKTPNTFQATKAINAIKAIAASSCTWVGAAAAHDGHGMGTALHWHATDTWGFAAVAALAALAFLLSRGDK